MSVGDAQLFVLCCCTVCSVVYAIAELLYVCLRTWLYAQHRQLRELGERNREVEAHTHTHTYTHRDTRTHKNTHTHIYKHTKTHTHTNAPDHATT